MKRYSTALTFKGIEIKTTVRYHFTTITMALVEKSTSNKCWRGCGEKRILLHCVWGCKLVQPLWKTGWSFPKKLKLPYDLGIPLLDIYPDKTNTKHKDTCTPMFIAVLCPANRWNIVQFLGHVLLFLQPRGLQPARLLCPWDFSGKSSERILSIHGLTLCLLHWQASSLPLSHHGSPIWNVTHP